MILGLTLGILCGCISVEGLEHSIHLMKHCRISKSAGVGSWHVRYTKEKRVDVLDDIKKGLNIPDCSEKHGVPVWVIYRWMTSEEPQMGESRVFKYTSFVLGAEAKITTCLSDVAGVDMTDDAWESTCGYVSKMLYRLVESIMNGEEEYWRQRGAT